MIKPLDFIVTGSEGLIGKYVCAQLETEGMSIARLDKALGHDLTDESQVKQIFAELRKRYDAWRLINLFAFNDHVAAGEQRGTLFDLPLESFRAALDVNVTALFSVCREFARDRQFGAIVNFSASTGITSPRPDLYDGAHKHFGYSVSKAAVRHLTKMLAVHFAPYVRVNCIAPGGIENGQPREFLEKYSKHTPMGSMMHIDQIMPAIDMLLDPRNSYMTGAEIVVDGGWTIV